MMYTRQIAMWIGAALLVPFSAQASQPNDALGGFPLDEPVLIGDQLVYPDGAAIPRYETEAERRWRLAHPPAAVRGITPPPTGPVWCPAEYEPMEGLLLAWEGTTTWKNILARMATYITTTGNADVYIAVDNTSLQTTAFNTIAALNSPAANMSRVKFVVRAIDTIWIRDYGPRYIYEGNCRAVVDHTYNRPTRLADNAYPSYFATVKRHAYYEHQLVHGGGNFHLDSLGRSYVTRLINNENPGLSEQQIHDIWQSYQNVDTTFYTPFPTSIDATQHIDMWMQVFDDDKVMISDWPNNAGSTQDVICDNAAVTMASRGYTVFRVPARSLSGVHYTYTNVVLCNDLILLPTYTNATIVNAGHNDQALAAWQAAAPGKTVVQVNCEGIVSAAGVMHCIVMHLPAHLGGESPTAYLRTPNGGEVFNPSQNVDIRWISDDNVLVVNADILLSTDGGANFDTVIASATADDGSHFWTVPDVYTTQARIRVVTRDAQGNTGYDDSDADFTINGSQGILGDMNCDGIVTPGDIAGFVLALTNPAEYANQYPGCDINNADVNDDGVVTPGDIAGFVALLTGA